MKKVIAIKKLNTGASVPFEFLVPDSAKEIRFIDWCKHSVMFSDEEDWFKDYFSCETVELMQDMAREWSKERYAAFRIKVCTMIGVLIGRPLGEILSLPNVHDLGDMTSLYVHLLLVSARYNPKMREEFMLNGKKYVMPRSTVMALDNIDYAVNLTTIEACHALYIEQMYGKTDEDGKYVLPNARFEMDLRIISAISRQILEEGDSRAERKIEMPPAEINLWGELQNNKFLEFQDMPLDVAMDVRFFLTKLKPNSKIIHLFQSHSSQQLQALRKQQEQGNTRKTSLQLGDGISPFQKSLISTTLPDRN